MSYTQQITRANVHSLRQHDDGIPPKDVELLQSYSDADLERHIQKSPKLPFPSHIYIISPSLIAKYCPLSSLPDTVQAMKAATLLGVRVPAAKRIVTSEEGTYLIMERIDGITLEEAWPKLGWIASVKLAWQLRRFVRLMRSLTSTTAGSLVSGECRSFYLRDRFMLPPSSSPGVITSFIQFWTSFKSIGQAMKTASQDPLPSTAFVPATPDTLVFTHHDLAPRNILLDHLGQLWLIDWDYAGWYPKYFEYAAMHNFPSEVWPRFAQARWVLFTWITAGRFEQERTVLEANRTKFTRFTFGRRFRILANRSPAGRPIS